MKIINKKNRLEIQDRRRRVIGYLEHRKQANGNLLIQSIYVKPLYRGRSYGKVMINALIRDLKTGVKIELYPCPFGDTKMSKTKLIQLYKELGFVKTKNGYMEKWI